MSTATETTITFPTTTNAQALCAAIKLALGDDDFMDSKKKVLKAVDALTPKDTLTATLKRLQGNAKKDFLDKKDNGVIGFIEENRADKIKGYVQERFQSYMDDLKTSEKAIKLFNAAYPPSAKAEAQCEVKTTGADTEKASGVTVTLQAESESNAEPATGVEMADEKQASPDVTVGVVPADEMKES